MYIPPSFVETDPTKLHDFMEQHSFATLISSHEGEPVASHLPLLLDRETEAETGTGPVLRESGGVSGV